MIGFFLAMGVFLIVEIVLALLHIGFVQEPYHAPVMFAVLVLADMVAAIVLPRNRKHVLCEDRVEVAEIFDKLGCYSELKVRRALANSHMLSSDVSAAYDPNYPKVNEKKNCAYFGKGLVFNKYTGRGGKSGSNDANPEYIASLRQALEKHEVTYQTSELGRVDQGGGGTIAYIMAKYNMQVIDSGVAVLSMHAPWEITSKADIYEAFCGYTAFLKEI